MENDGTFKRNAFVSVHRPGADRRPSDLSVRLPSGGEPGAEAIFHDRGRIIPCIIWSPVCGRGLWVGSPGGIHPRGGRRRSAAPSDHRQWEDQERCGHCYDLRRLSGCGDHRHILDHGNDHRRQQLYVRQHPGHEPGGRGIERRPVPDRPGDVHSLLQ